MNINELLKLHEINFGVDGLGWTHAKGRGLAWFLNDLQDADFLPEIIDRCAEKLEGAPNHYEKDWFSYNVFSARLTDDRVEITGLSSVFAGVLQTIPLRDFKMILEKWLEFLEKHG
ncbi:hypothetical protein [Pedobacter sp. N23S346]|uniref:hypothetical protein n=1 Tax=Pedobacter sp. N23S346 TaxID=3402750 RepID=UPI003AC66245